MERAGTGLQVTPQTLAHSRDEFYSEKAYRYFDYPARFSARIKAKYLDSANNEYEAGLRPEFIDFLEDITIKRFDTGATYTIKSIEELAALEAFFRAQKRNKIPKPSLSASPSGHGTDSLETVSLSTFATPVTTGLANAMPAPILSIRSMAVQGRDNSFYLLWMAAVIFSIVSLIALCWALNVLLAPTLGMGPMAIAVAAALFIKTTPFYLSLIYTATSAATGLIAVSLFKTRARPVEVDPELALARMEWERIQTMRSH